MSEPLLKVSRNENLLVRVGTSDVRCVAEQWAAADGKKELRVYRIEGGATPDTVAALRALADEQGALLAIDIQRE